MDLKVPTNKFETASRAANLVSSAAMRANTGSTFKAAPNMDAYHKTGGFAGPLSNSKPMSGTALNAGGFAGSLANSEGFTGPPLSTGGFAGSFQSFSQMPSTMFQREDLGEYGDFYDRVSDGVFVAEDAQSLIRDFSAALRQQDVDLLFNFQGVLGDFSVVEFEAVEKINAPFEVSMRLASTDPTVDLHGLMDTEGVLGIYDRYQEARFIHGVVTDIERADAGTHRTQYRIVLRPAIWRLSQGSDSRIFQQMTVPEIAKQVLSEYYVTNTEWRLAETHPKREYLTQLSETHLDFITRILSEEGIYYFFEHSVQGHKLVFTDAPLASQPLANASQITYNALTGGTKRDEPFIKRFSQIERLRSSSYEINDYTFKNPNARMNTARDAQEENGLKSRYALYEYPGRYKDPDGVGKTFVKKRIDAVRVDATNGSGETSSVHLSPGFRFTMSDNPDERLNDSHFILEVVHHGTQSVAMEEEAGSNLSTDYKASFKTMPARLPYSPPVPKKPTVEGPQIAIVTGPAGEEIYTDEFGRVKVHFPWDRYNAKDENSSCWIRVSQAWAGSGFGGMMIPRIGQEVIVAYLDGDIDQPIIIGRTFHAVNKVPNGLPAAKTQMSLRSQTHKGEGYNELTFEDEAGKEEMRMHAQKDQNNTVGNNQTHNIANDRNKTVGKNQNESVGANKSSSVGGNKSQQIAQDYNVNVGGSRSISVGGSQTEGIGGSQSVTVSGSQSTTVAGARSLAVTGDHSETNSASKTVKVGGSMKETIDGMYSLTVEKTSATNITLGSYMTVGQASKEKVGTNKEIKVTNKMTIDCGDQLILKSGSSQIILNKDGSIRISGKSLNISMSDAIQLWGSTIDLN